MSAVTSSSTPPGRALDALIAEQVMGLRRRLPGEFDWAEHEWFTVEGARPRTLPHYSTDIAAAWTVVEKLSDYVSKRDEPWWSFAIFNAQKNQIGARIYACPPGSSIFDVRTVIAEAVGNSAPHAICLAALLAQAQLTNAGGAS
jgi:hypothetical protein